MKWKERRQQLSDTKTTKIKIEEKERAHLLADWSRAFSSSAGRSTTGKWARAMWLSTWKEPTVSRVFHPPALVTPSSVP